MGLLLRARGHAAVHQGAAALTKSLAQDDVRKKMLSAAFVAEKGMGQEKSSAFLTSETKKWKSVIQTAHIMQD